VTATFPAGLLAPQGFDRHLDDLGERVAAQALAVRVQVTAEVCRLAAGLGPSGRQNALEALRRAEAAMDGAIAAGDLKALRAAARRAVDEARHWVEASRPEPGDEWEWVNDAYIDDRGNTRYASRRMRRVS
jgi:hypothetical protein